MSYKAYNYEQGYGTYEMFALSRTSIALYLYTN